MTYAYYGILADAQEYFDNRLHSRAWTRARLADQPKALYAARVIIDTLNYKGQKSPVWVALEADAKASDATLAAADATQEFQFPRGSDTQVPDAILIAQWEIAYSLLDGKDPEIELENLGITSQGLSSLRTTFNRSQVPIDHIVNGVPNAIAWRLLTPFLRDEDVLILQRVS